MMGSPAEEEAGLVVALDGTIASTWLRASPAAPVRRLPGTSSESLEGAVGGVPKLL